MIPTIQPTNTWPSVSFQNAHIQNSILPPVCKDTKLHLKDRVPDARLLWLWLWILPSPGMLRSVILYTRTDFWKKSICARLHGVTCQDGSNMHSVKMYRVREQQDYEE